MENGGWHLAAVPGVDVLLLGHAHTEFPGPRYAGMTDVDAERGFVRGVPAVMGGFFGKDLGVIQLALDRQNGRWVIDKGQTHSEVRPICPKKNECVPADPVIAPLVAQPHQAAVAYVNTPIGQSSIRMSSYFADEGNMTALAPVNAAHERLRAAASCPSRTRSWPSCRYCRPPRRSAPALAARMTTLTWQPGPLTLRSAADLYFYPNTLAAVKIDGAGLKAWLEKSAERFNRIDPSKEGAQSLINEHYPGFNFDQIQGGIAYTIDVSRPVGERIVKLSWKGKPVTPRQPFIVATNNYRASGGGHFPGLDGKNIVLAAPDGTREILAKWLQARQSIGAKDLPATSWHFAPLKTHGQVVFKGAAGKQDVARAADITSVRELKDNGDGTALYAIDLAH